MSVRAILAWPDPRLSQRCAPVARPAGIGTLVADLFDTMYAAGGRGLAAPQIGVLERVFVMDVGWKSGVPTPLVCVNPEVLERCGDEAEGPEVCLSMPGMPVAVTRHRQITLRFDDASGVRQERRLSGVEAICAQHEYDHLDGVMHFDRLSATARARHLAAFEAAP